MNLDKITFQDILPAITNSMNNIEKNDRRCTDIVIPEKFYHLVLSEPYLIDRTQYDRGTDVPRYIGYHSSHPFLWGCRVRKGKNFGVVAQEPQFQTMVESFSEFKLKISILRKNSITIVKARGEPVYQYNKQEEVALDFLRDLVTEADYRKYISHGFLLVRSQSNKIYQIFRSNKRIRVWENGELIEQICVYLTDDKIPMTDKVIAFKTMIESDEEKFRTLGNIYKGVGRAA